MSITAGPEASVAEATVLFGFSASLRTVRFACSLDGAAATPCESPVTYAGLAEGRHLFEVTASAGRERATAALRWQIVPPPPLPPPPPSPPPPPDGPLPIPPGPPGPPVLGSHERIVFVELGP